MTVKVAEGQTSANFKISTTSVAATTGVVIKAEVNGSSATAKLRVTP
jgi:hypothetical protein